MNAEKPDVVEIMSLVSELYCNGSSRNRKSLESAITALVESRDALQLRVAELEKANGELIRHIRELSCDGNFVYINRVRKEAREFITRIQGGL